MITVTVSVHDIVIFKLFSVICADNNVILFVFVRFLFIVACVYVVCATSSRTMR